MVTVSGPNGERISASRVVDTHAGKVQGLVMDGVSRFLGMRYAAAPTGLNRFRPPRDVAKWEGVAEAIHYGAPAMQGMPREMLHPRNDFELLSNLASPFAGLSKIHNEDCLYLNVWTTGHEGIRPVLVWFHGGGFAYGAGSEPLYEGTRLADRHDIVVVTVNHRLNLFGYMNLVGTHESFGDAVNAGAHDLVKALEWVQLNIAKFGGDPDNVTIAGESGGAAKVGDLMAFPAAKGLFAKAIAMSGARERAVPFDEAQQNSLRILRQLGITKIDPEEIASIPAGRLLDAGLDAFSNPGGENVRYQEVEDMGDLAVLFGTTVDGHLLPDDPFGAGAPIESAEKPLLIGWTKDEWTLMLVERDPEFIAMTEQDLAFAAANMYGDRGPEMVAVLRGLFPDYSPGHLSAQLVGTTISRDMVAIAAKKAAQSALVFAYELAWETPVHGGIYRSTHSLDLPLMFDNVERARAFVGAGDEPQQMADLVSSTWASFMHNGAPSIPSGPNWEPFTPAGKHVMRLNLHSELVQDPLGPAHRIIDETLFASDTGQPHITDLTGEVNP